MDTPAPAPPAPPDPAPPPPSLKAQWNGISYSVQAQRDLHAVVLDTAEADGDELWVLQLGQPAGHRVDKLVRGRIPRTRPSSSVAARLDTLDFRQATVTPDDWELELDHENLFHWGHGSGSPAASETWEASQTFVREGPAAAELLQAPWVVSVSPLEGTASRAFVVTVGGQGELEASDGSCTLQGRLRAIAGSDWFDMNLKLTGCATGHDATALRGFGKLLRPPGPMRFVGAVLGPGAKAGLSVSALPVLR